MAIYNMNYTFSISIFIIGSISQKIHKSCNPGQIYYIASLNQP